MLFRSPKAIGIGLSKTGTTSLGEAFRILGYKHRSYDMPMIEAYGRGDIGKILRKARHFDSLEDAPWFLVWRELSEAFPKAKFVLTVRRDPETWLHSYLSHCDRLGPTRAREICYGDSDPLLFYRQHNNEVRRHFAGKNNFIELCWETGDGWEELCRFLCKPAPDCPFPHLNRSDQAGNTVTIT